MSSIQGAKAISLVTKGRIVERKGARVFGAQGSQGDLHTVVIATHDDDGTSCSCQAGRHGTLCYHVRAARLLIAKERERE